VNRLIQQAYAPPPRPRAVQTVAPLAAERGIRPELARTT
jgi:hypothetical protein